MNIKLYNSLTDKLEDFHPIKEGEVTCYVCGPTVYNYVHVGNLRPVVVFDVLRRLFTYLGYKVTFISNFTDIDDKIIRQAKIEGCSEKEISEKYIEAFENAREGIHSLKPTYQPKVTETMDQIIKFIQDLMDKGYAYEIDGDVYFRVKKVEDYGCLSNMKIDDLLVGARIEENSKKESPLDFTLWKKTEEGIKFNSPWSNGRPGWHSECGVMINSLIDEKKIDIHGGGFDLKFPHHENEIAQQMALHNNKIANYWMHNGFINVDNVKMSKSLGNVILANDYINLYGGNVVRFMLVNTHYRVPVNFSNDLVESARKELDKLSSTYSRLAVTLQLNEGELVKTNNLDIDNFIEALCDVLNTANAMRVVYRVIKESNVALRNRPIDNDKLRVCFSTLEKMFELLGLSFDYPVLSEDDRRLYQEYNEAKANKDFAKSDEIRQKLIERKIM